MDGSRNRGRQPTKWRYKIDSYWERVNWKSREKDRMTHGANMLRRSSSSRQMTMMIIKIQMNNFSSSDCLVYIIYDMMIWILFLSTVVEGNVAYYIPLGIINVTGLRLSMVCLKTMPCALLCWSNVYGDCKCRHILDVQSMIILFQCPSRYQCRAYVIWLQVLFAGVSVGLLSFRWTCPNQYDHHPLVAYNRCGPSTCL